MQVAVVDDDHVLIYDRAERNPLKSTNGKPAWGSVYTISTQAVRPLNLTTSSFCAGGGWIGNGTMVSVGGNPPEGAAANGLQSIRLFTPCGDETCDVYEDPARLHMTANRWYPSTVRLDDGSLMIFGGSPLGAYANVHAKNASTYEFFPPKGDGKAVYSPFLWNALTPNLFPVMFLLPDGTIFVAANQIAMIYDWRTKTEIRLPSIPNGVRINYPVSAATALLPLTIANNFTAEILMCGGSTANVEAYIGRLSANYPASSQCIRMVLNDAGIAGGWQIEQMPEARVMADAVLTPDGKVIIVNGAGSGIAGYGTVQNRTGQSNAANPIYHADVYDPLGIPGQRFLTNMPVSSIERLYHSSATLLPDATIMISGSNPNNGFTTKVYATRFDVEILSPPYVTMSRPGILQYPPQLLYRTQYNITATLPSGTKVVTAVIMDLGFSTHGLHSSIRSVELAVTTYGSQIVITAPGSAGIYPPGYGWLYLLADGVPSKGFRIMIGPGDAPPSSIISPVIPPPPPSNGTSIPYGTNITGEVPPQ